MKGTRRNREGEGPRDEADYEAMTRKHGDKLFSIVAMLVAISLLAAFALALVGAPTVGAAPAAQPGLQIALSKDAYSYGTDATASFRITVNNQSRQAVRNVSVRAKVYPANDSRQAFDEYLDGKLGAYKFTRTIESDTMLREGPNDFSMELSLSDRGLGEGVYPVIVEVLRSREQLAYAGTQLVVLSPDKSDPPLQVALVFEVMEPPRQGLDGKFDDSKLALECHSSSTSHGWLSLVSTLDKYPNLHASLALSPLLVDELAQLSKGGVIRGERGKPDKKLTLKSPDAAAASNVLKNFQKLSGVPRFEYITTPYATPDIENLWRLEWFDDARDQISRGSKVLEDGLEMALSKEYFYPPALNMNSRVLRNLGPSIGGFMVLDSRLLDRSKEGKKILKGDTLTAPVKLSGAAGRQTIALFSDSRLSRVIARVSTSDDAYGVTQCIVSELANLYLESPRKKRAVTVVWPSNWRPKQDVLNELMKLFDGTTWLKTATLGETITTMAPVNKQPLRIPDAPAALEAPVGGGSEGYFTRIASTRKSFEAYSGLVFHDNPRLAIDQQGLYTTQSDVFRQWGKQRDGLSLAADLSANIQGEMSKIELPKSPAITVTGSNAKIPITITNATGYRVKATLEVSSNGLSFPGGSTKRLVLEPKENLVDVPVSVTKKGKVLFRAKLLAGRTVLKTIEMPVQTGRFSTFAMVVVGVLLALILSIWAGRVLRRRKSARHSARNKRKPGPKEEDPQGA